MVAGDCQASDCLAKGSLVYDHDVVSRLQFDVNINLNIKLYFLCLFSSEKYVKYVDGYQTTRRMRFKWMTCRVVI